MAFLVMEGNEVYQVSDCRLVRLLQLQVAGVLQAH